MRLSRYLRVHGSTRFLDSLFEEIPLHPERELESRLRTLPSLRIEDVSVESRLGRAEFACFLYLKALRTLPVLVRAWWMEECDRRTYQEIERFTVKYIGSLLVGLELSQVAEHASSHKEEHFSVRGTFALLRQQHFSIACDRLTDDGRERVG
jgi:hypothetical protein